MASIKLANGTDIKDIKVWDGVRWKSRIGMYFDGNKWNEIYRPTAHFSDDGITTNGTIRRSTTALVNNGLKFDKSTSYTVRHELFKDDFDTLNYSTYSTTVNSVGNSILNVTSETNDPMLSMEAIGSFDPNIARYVIMKYRISNGIWTGWEIFYTNDRYPFAHGEHHIYGGDLIADGNWHESIIDCWSHPDWKNYGNIRGWRFDWVTSPGVNMEIDYIVLTS